MQDYSFLRLEPDFTKAKSESLPLLARLGYFDQIQLLPSETYLQITNTPLGIAFGGNYAVYLVDYRDNIIDEITGNVAISEFVDNSGINQIAFEIANIGKDYYSKQLHLKFVHTVSDYVWYSNPFFCTDYRKEFTTRFDFRSYADHYGTAYNVAAYYQSIRLRCFYSGPDFSDSSVGYTTINGKEVTSRVIQTEFEKYTFERIDTFTYRRLNKLLVSPVIFVNGNRVADKQTIAGEDFSGTTNVFNIDFKVCIDYTETFTPSFQIFNPLTLTFYAPEGYFTLAGLPTTVNGTFNRDVTEVSGTMDLIDNSDDSIIHSYPISEITTISNLISANLAPYILANGDYKIRINSGVFVSSLFGEVFEGFEWDFIVSDGDYLASDYQSPDYFTT